MKIEIAIYLRRCWMRKSQRKIMIDVNMRKSLMKNALKDMTDKDLAGIYETVRDGESTKTVKITVPLQMR